MDGEVKDEIGIDEEANDKVDKETQDKIEKDTNASTKKIIERGVVEIYLKKFSITPYPNMGLFNFETPMTVLITR